MVRKLAILSLGAAVLLVASAAFAEEVFVTQNGKKYHVATCQLIKERETSALDEKAAMEQGYAPCGRCLKGKPLAEQASLTQDKKASLSKSGK